MAKQDAPALQAPEAMDEQDVFAFPASFAQQRLWFLDQLDPGVPVYSIPQALHLSGPLDVAALHQALREIVRRHEALRTTFTSRDGSPLQIVAPALSVPLPLTDLAQLPEAARAAEAQRLADEDARRPFDLAQGPLLRAGLLRLGANEHVLLLNVHHITCDGWSLGVLFRELSLLYQSGQSGRAARAPGAPPLPEPAVQQADHAIWERERLEGEALDRQVAFWRERFGGDLPTLELPADRHPPLRTSRGGCLRFDLAPALTDALQALGRREGTSLFMTLLAAFQVWLARLSGQQVVLVGSPMANRDRPELEGAIGFFTSTVVLRADLAGDPTFREHLQRVKEEALRAFAQQEVPLERIVEAVRPGRAPGQNPMFQAMFAVQRAPESALDLPGVSVRLLPVHSATAKFDVLIEMQELSRGMQCFLEYSTDLFEEDTARRMLGHFQTLLQGIAAAPERRLSELPLLTEAERRRLLVEWNDTGAEIPRSCAHDLIAAQAQAAPGRVAVEFAEGSLTYGELDRRAGLLARHLQGRGVGPDVLVGVCLERSLDLPVALLGVLKAGGAYLPLDSAHPPERIAYMLADAGVRVLLTQEALLPDLPASEAQVVLLDRDWPAIDQGGQGPDPTAVTPEHLAYTIYTSGSTGRPKGVQVPHRALVNFLCSMRREPGVEPDDRLLAVTTISFDIAGLELWLPLSAGATVIIASREEALDGEALQRLIEERRPTVMQATPATFRLLIEAGWRGVLKRLLCGGEALPATLAAQLLERAPALWNMYGPTETTIWSTCCRVRDGGRVSIGRPIANTRLYLLDAQRQPVPVGVTGELYIGGAGVARGYLGRPELTAERFLPDPFAGEPGARMYRTGDLCRYLEDGGVEYLRRNDHQVKVRGFRIELGEIEAVLAQHPAVREAVVVVREDTPGDHRLVAYVVYRPGESSTSSELRGFLRDKLPEYMVPHLVVELERLPLSPAGKVDRRALPDPLGGADEEDSHVAPRTDMEQRIARLFQEVIRVPRVGLLDNFYNLGGHSLLSVQLVHRIEQETGHRLNPRSLVFQNVEQVAAECERAQQRPEAERPAKPRSLLGALKGRIFGSEG